jgi:hypothetical protein
MLLSLLLPAFGAVDTVELRTHAQRDMARVAYALAAYHSEHDQYPETLNLLTPRYIAEIPADPFAGDAMRYRRVDEDYLLYSVGADREDDDGRGYDSEPRGDDIALRPHP